MGCIELCGGVHTAQTPTQTEITIEPIVVCICICVCVGVCVGVGQCECTITANGHFSIPQELYQSKPWNSRMCSAASRNILQRPYSYSRLQGFSSRMVPVEAVRPATGVNSASSMTQRAPQSDRVTVLATLASDKE